MIKSLYSCVVEQHSLALVVLAAAICWLGTYSTFALGRHVYRFDTLRGKLPWALAAVTATSAAIWATHFIAMLAFRPGMASGFDPGMTAASFGLAWGLGAAGAAIVMMRPDLVGRLAGGTVIGVAISAMHYTGMAAYKVQGHLHWDTTTVAISVVAGCVLAAIAMAMGFSPKHKLLRRFAPIVLLLAVCSAHFIGMSALTLTFDPTVLVPDNALSNGVLTILTANMALLVVGLSLASLRVWLSNRRRRQAESRRLRDLADIAVEGLVICDGETVDGVNRSLEHIVGVAREELLGLPLRNLLPGIGIEDVPHGHEVDATLLGPDGDEIPVRIIAQDIGIDGKLRRVVAVRDQRERLRVEAAMHHLAHHDALTGIANRLHFNDALAVLFAEGRMDGLALLALDLDRFKGVNDTLGHAGGDALLRLVAERLRNALRDGDLVARLGGDEFAIQLPDAADLETVRATAETIIENLSRPYSIDGQVVEIGVSIGIAIAPQDGRSPAELLRNADLALYGAKEAGRGCFRMFEREMDERMKARRTLEADLRRALAQGEFELYYQPLVNAKTGGFDGAEALVRWHHPVRGLVSPADFIPLAEETGLIGALGEWVLRTACCEARTWPSSMTVSVNLSPIQLHDPGLPDIVAALLEEVGLPGERLELEVTESALLQDEERTLSTLLRLRALGIRISMDDFGTGYSSLSYLRRFPFDKIKIDRSFVHATPADSESAAIVRAITMLGSSLGLRTTAEGVETEAQSLFITSQGCDQLQGYLYSRPVPRAEIAALFTDEPRLVA